MGKCRSHKWEKLHRMKYGNGVKGRNVIFLRKLSVTKPSVKKIPKFRAWIFFLSLVGIPPNVDNLAQLLLIVGHISVTESHASTVSGVSKSVPVATRSKA